MLRARSRLRASTGLAVWSLNLELATAAGGLDPRVTFSRGTNATLVDATGRVTYAPNNLLTNSESFEASAWNKSGATVTANSTAAPDGTTTADALVEDATTGLHLTQQSFAFVSGVSYTVSVYVKAGIRTWVQMLLPSAAFTASQGGFFDLTGAGALGTTNGTPTARTITALANGWYRISVTATATTSASGNVAIVAASANGTTSYAGSNGSTAVLLWGAQLEAVTYQTTPGAYNSTTPKNLLGFTQEFDNAAWTKTRSSITPNAAVAPDGTTTADKLVTDTTAGSHIVFQQLSTQAAGSYVFSVYAKAAELSSITLQQTISTTYGATFNLLTGAVSGLIGGAVGTATAVGDGWYRCSIAYTTTSAIALTGAIYTGFPPNDGTSGVFLWGAQLSNSASLDPYVYNPGAAPTSAAFYGPRFDFDPVTLAPRGLLIEEQRTNLLLRSEEFDNASWSKLRATVTANSTTAPDGTTTADTLLDTAVAGTHVAIQTTAKAASAITYAASVWLKADVRDQGELRVSDQAGNGVRCTFNLTTAAVGAAATFGTGFTAVSSQISQFANGWYRVVLVATSNTATTIGHEVYIANASGSISYTGTGAGFFVWGAQLEAGAFATSYIPTVASQVTRNADSAAMTGANFASWYNSSQGTLLVEASQPSIFASSRTAASVSDGGTTRFNVYRQSAGNVQGFITPGAGALATTVIAAANVPWKGALGYDTTTGSFVANGSAAASGSHTIPLGTLNALAIGSVQPTGGEIFNGHIRSIRYYPTRLSNAQLQALTA
ncbi:hypothetical protein UFOVP351_36 [uncultured Caudovirales phage]|uniref:Concanavalin A-like lectin/glucanases superfamily n=1 Tax=uncultured Caudovirales phage TaxID=2100421 RepID=A0A6J5M666_9CAUD|nr:hypothetical protein UFOVP351_36 [uncultured Caudovirales phage]